MAGILTITTSYAELLSNAEVYCITPMLCKIQSNIEHSLESISQPQE